MTSTSFFVSKRSAWRVPLACLMLVCAVGCATGPDANPRDPMEPLNRSIYRFNDVVDDAVLKPVATAYQQVTPRMVQTGVGNFFGNLGDLQSSVHAGLQLRPRAVAENLMRFSVNTVFGFAGALDIASELGIPRTRLDMGHTLGRWGVPAGAYLVLPILGPSSARDGAGTLVDMSVDPLSGMSDVSARNALTALRVVDGRAGLLRATSLLDEAALDAYSFTRDLYLDRRQGQIDDLIDRGIGLGDRSE